MTVHPFEEMGLGKAPFKWLRMYADVGPHKWVDKKTGISYESGAPGQPMGSCDYCGTGIMYVNVIRSADGKKSNIGSDCVRKVCDKASHAVMCVERELRYLRNTPELRESRKEKRHAREEAKIAELKLWLADPSVQVILDEKPHPYKERADLGDTLLNWAEWMLENAGNSGRCRAWSRVKKLL